jgi:hypothetical protein
MVMRQYCGFVEGYMATTDADLHGDKLAPTAISSLERQLNENPDRRVLNVRHDPKHLIGDIVEWRVDSKSDWRGLWVKVGIYEGCEDFLAQMEKGELGFFSLEAYHLEEGTHGIPDGNEFSADTYRMRLEVRPDLRHEVTERLAGEDIESRVFVRKGADFPAIIEIATTSALIVLKLYDIWKNIRDREKGEKTSVQQNVNIFNIVISNQTLNFEQHNVEYIVQHLEQTKDCGDRKRP